MVASLSLKINTGNSHGDKMLRILQPQYILQE